MTPRSLLPAVALAAASVALLAGCTSATTDSTATGTNSPTVGSTPTAANTPATPKESAAAAKNDNKCVNDVAWMTFDDGKPTSRSLQGGCDSVIVFGDKGHLDADKAGTVTIMGDGNTVTVTSVGKVDFEGTGNTITYSGTKPAVLEAGKGNTLRAG